MDRFLHWMAFMIVFAWAGVGLFILVTLMMMSPEFSLFMLAAMAFAVSMPHLLDKGLPWKK